MSFTAELHPRQAPLPLWREVEALLRQLCALFGEPREIAFLHTLTALAHKQLSQWLRGCEAMMRQLLLIEASALTPVPAVARPPSTRAAHAASLLPGGGGGAAHD